jgi:hypothetical protein
VADFLNKLNPQQREAVEAVDGPVLILAGAGSGKTRVITYRIAHLIENKGVEPDAILAVTFTNKAAAEMAERVGDLLGGRTLRKPLIATFHSFCVRVLRRDIEELKIGGAGYKKDFAIYDESDQQSVVKGVMRNGFFALSLGGTRRNSQTDDERTHEEGLIRDVRSGLGSLTWPPLACKQVGILVRFSLLSPEWSFFSNVVWFSLLVVATPYYLQPDSSLTSAARSQLVPQPCTLRTSSASPRRARFSARACGGRRQRAGWHLPDRLLMQSSSPRGPCDQATGA